MPMDINRRVCTSGDYLKSALKKKSYDMSFVIFSNGKLVRPKKQHLSTSCGKNVHFSNDVLIVAGSSGRPNVAKVSLKSVDNHQDRNTTRKYKCII